MTTKTQQDSIKKISDALTRIHAIIGAHSFSETFNTAAQKVDFRPAQIAAITNGFNSTLKRFYKDRMHEFGKSEKDSLIISLSHAFQDIPRKTIQTVVYMNSFDEPETEKKQVERIKKFAEDVLANYPKILKGHISPEIQTVLDIYKNEIIPAATAYLPKDTPDADLNQGGEHIHLLKDYE